MDESVARLPDATTLGWVRLRVPNRERALAFYRDILGYLVTEETPGVVALRPEGGGRPHFLLHEQLGIRPRVQSAAGLYHTAILLPDRRSLARLIRHLLDRQWPLTGGADHGVSEAFYLDDPDHNGLELYADRPRDLWPRAADGSIAMYTDPIDLPSLFAELGDHPAPWTTMPADARVGHVHLQVTDLRKAEHFYCDILGFTVMQRSYPGALFVAVGGYHHHLGLNIWHSRHGDPLPEDTAGLISFALVLPDRASWDAALARLQQAKRPIEDSLHSEVGHGVRTRDFDNIAVELWYPA
jgi:catechol 2,3-dioxygenase